MSELKVRQSDLPSEKTSNDMVSLADFVRVFKKNAWWILAVSFVVCGLVGVWSITRPRLYVARTSLVPPLEMLESKMSLGRGLNNQLSQLLDRGGGISSLFKEVLQSQVVADVIITQLHLMDAYKVGDLLEARKRLSGKTTITIPRMSSIVIVEVTDEDPNRAVAIANAYVEQLDKLNRSLLGGEATGKRVFLDNRLTEISREFNDIGDLKSREVQVKEMLYELLSREYELAKIEEAKSLPTINVLDRASLPATPLGRGTIKKALSGGIGAMVVLILMVCVREGLF